MEYQSARLGTVSNTGLYTTPAAIPTLQTVTIKATSVADPSKSASASVSLSPLTISISPSSANRYAGQTQQFNASIQKSTNTNVNWSISPIGTGSISATGLYTAPSAVPSATTVSVTAASAADPTKTVSASVALNALTMSISPQSANLNAGQTHQFSAQVNQNTITAVAWTINPNVGTISTSGLYTAPAILGSQRTVQASLRLREVI